MPAVYGRAPPSRKPDTRLGEVTSAGGIRCEEEASISLTLSSQHSLLPAPVTTPAENGTEAYRQGCVSRFSNSGDLICSSDCSGDLVGARLIAALTALNETSLGTFPALSSVPPGSLGELGHNHC